MGLILLAGLLVSQAPGPEGLKPVPDPHYYPAAGDRIVASGQVVPVINESRDVARFLRAIQSDTPDDLAKMAADGKLCFVPGGTRLLVLGRHEERSLNQAWEFIEARVLQGERVLLVEANELQAEAIVRKIDVNERHWWFGDIGDPGAIQVIYRAAAANSSRPSGA